MDKPGDPHDRARFEGTWRGQLNAAGSFRFAITFSRHDEDFIARYFVDNQPSDGWHSVKLVDDTAAFDDSLGNHFALRLKGDLIQGHVYQRAMPTAELRDLAREP